MIPLSNFPEIPHDSRALLEVTRVGFSSLLCWKNLITTSDITTRSHLLKCDSHLCTISSSLLLHLINTICGFYFSSYIRGKIMSTVPGGTSQLPCPANSCWGRRHFDFLLTAHFAYELSCQLQSISAINLISSTIVVLFKVKWQGTFI